MKEMIQLIRDVPDFPKPGITFKDITPLLQDGPAFQKTIRALASHLSGTGINKVVGIESRGFIFGAAVASHLGLGFIPVRKHGKLPWTKISEEYVLEYGTDRLEMHADSLTSKDRVAIVDDLLATGGTVEAVCKMVEKQGAKVHLLSFIVELDFLKGRERLKGREIFSMVHY